MYVRPEVRGMGIIGCLCICKGHTDNQTYRPWDHKLIGYLPVYSSFRVTEAGLALKLLEMPGGAGLPWTRRTSPRQCAVALASPTFAKVTREFHL